MSLPGRRPGGDALQGVVFDFDGVIADTEGLHLKAFQDVLRDHGMALSDDDYRDRYLGFDDAGVFTAVAADGGRRLDHHDLRRMIAAKGERFAALAAGGDVLFPEAPACIERLAGGLVLGIASGALHHEIDAILRAAGLRAHFAAIVAADDVERAKPAPDSYARAVALLSATLGIAPAPDAFIAIEDSRWGIEAAVAAGLPCIGVTTSYPASELPGAATVVPGLASLDSSTLQAVHARARVDVRTPPVHN